MNNLQTTEEQFEEYIEELNYRLDKFIEQQEEHFLSEESSQGELVKNLEYCDYKQVLRFINSSLDNLEYFTHKHKHLDFTSLQFKIFRQFINGLEEHKLFKLLRQYIEVWSTTTLNDTSLRLYTSTTEELELDLTEEFNKQEVELLCEYNKDFIFDKNLKTVYLNGYYSHVAELDLEDLIEDYLIDNIDLT